MSLLVTPYDPTGAARVLIQAQQQGQAAQLAQQQQAIELAKSVADARRHEIEFSRTLEFNEAKEANDMGYKYDALDQSRQNQLRDETENRRRYDLENEPFKNPFESPASAPMAASLPVETGGSSIPAATSEIGSEGLSPAKMLPTEGGAVDAEAAAAQKAADDNIAVARAKEALRLQTPAGRAGTRSLPVDQGALPVAGAAPADNPLIEGVKSKLSVLGQILAEGGVSKKKATAIIGESARNLLAPARQSSAATEKGTRFVNADTGEQYIMKQNGQMVDVDGNPVNPEDAQRLQKIGSQSAAREQLAETKQKTAVEQKAAEVKAKVEKESAAAKAKLVEQERVNLRTYRAQRKALPTNEKGELVGDAIDNAKAIDAQIAASEQRLAAMGAKEGEAAAPATTAPDRPIFKDAAGNRAYKNPDGSFEPIP